MKRYIFPDPLDAHCVLQPDESGPIAGVPDTHPSNGAPCQSFDVPSSVPNKHGATLTIEKKGYAPYILHGILDTVTAGGGGYEVDVFRLQKAGSVRPFRLDGHFCRYLDDGTEMLINETTGFRLFARWRAGEVAAETFVQSCVDHRLNCVRVSGMQDTTLYLTDPALRYRIFPDDAQYYRDLADFYDWCGSYGLTLDFVCCMQTQTLMPNETRQIAHLQQIFDVFHDHYALVSKVNEQGVHDNSISAGALALPKPAGATFILSTGSKESGNEDPLEPIADDVEIHLNDANEWWRKGHNAWEIANRVNRSGRVSETTRTDKDGNLAHFEDDGKTQTAMTTAALIHSPEGKNADPFTTSVPQIDAHNAGVFAVPLAQRRGNYQRFDNPDVLRDYQMGTYRWQVRY